MSTAQRRRILEDVQEALAIELQAIEALSGRVGEEAVDAVELVLGCRGRVFVTGMGKAGLVGRKLAATLSSTGTPASFLHPAEAYHGDLGVITDQDVVLALSNSGETEELVRLLPHFGRMGVPVVALTGNTASTLARYSQVVIDVGVAREADPLDLAPTASTTTAIAMGDALAAALLKCRGFTRDQFAIFHPGGSLGRRLLWKVADLMHTGEELPRVAPDLPLRDAIYVMSTKRLGTLLVTEGDRLLGIFTDGDLRRLLGDAGNPLGQPMREVMIRDPRVTRSETLAARALKLMEDNAITLLPVLDGEDRLVGAIHVHDLVRAGLV